MISRQMQTNRSVLGVLLMAVSNAGDMIRVNLDFPIQEWPLSRRQLNDNVVKSALVFLAQCSNLTGNTGAPANPFGKNGLETANCLLDDFVTADDVTPGGDGHLPSFPYGFFINKNAKSQTT